MGWYEVSVSCAGGAAAAVADSLERAGARAVTYLDAADSPVLEPRPGAVALWPHTRVKGLFEAAPGHDAALGARVRSQLERGGLAGWEAQVHPLVARDWVAEHRAGLRPRSFGHGLWVCPPDGPAPAGARAVVRLEPGIAFGTGSHPTTALCLEWLAMQPLAGAAMVDYGCGSGILGIAAARLGAARVVMIDDDPQAVAAANANAARNGVADRARAAAPEGQDAAPAADFLVANILLEPLVALGGDFRDRVRAGGGVCLSGVLEAQCAELARAYRGWLERTEAGVRGGWARLAGRRGSGPLTGRG